MNDPLILIRNLLREEWNQSNITTYDTRPDIHIGWFGDRHERPQISVGTRTDPNESGSYTAIDGSTGEVVETFIGTVTLNAWGSSKDLLKNDSDANVIAPGAIAWDYRKEIRRCLKKNATGIIDTDTNTRVLTHVKDRDARRLSDDGADPVVRYEIIVEYEYEIR